MVGVNSVGVFAVILAVKLGQQLGGSRHRLSGDAVLVLELFNELVMLDKRMIFAADFAADADGTMGGFLSLEVVAVVQLDLVDTGKAPHKVQVPIAAAEFTIGDGVVAGALLLFDEQGDLFIFHSGQLLAGDLAGLELGAGGLDSLRTQEAAHKIVTERGAQCSHSTVPLYVNFLCSSIGTVYSTMRLL